MASVEPVEVLLDLFGVRAIPRVAIVQLRDALQIYAGPTDGEDARIIRQVGREPLNSQIGNLLQSVHRRRDRIVVESKTPADLVHHRRAKQVSVGDGRRTVVALLKAL